MQLIWWQKSLTYYIANCQTLRLESKHGCDNGGWSRNGVILVLLYVFYSESFLPPSLSSYHTGRIVHLWNLIQQSSLFVSHMLTLSVPYSAKWSTCLSRTRLTKESSTQRNSPPSKWPWVAAFPYIHRNRDTNTANYKTTMPHAHVRVWLDGFCRRTWFWLWTPRQPSAAWWWASTPMIWWLGNPIWWWACSGRLSKLVCLLI